MNLSIKRLLMNSFFFSAVFTAMNSLGSANFYFEVKFLVEFNYIYIHTYLHSAKHTRKLDFCHL